MTEEQRAQFQVQMQKMRETTDKIREQALQRISKSLSKKQGAAYKKLIGEPFDFSKLTFRGFGGQRGRQNGPNGQNGQNGQAPSNNGNAGGGARGPASVDAAKSDSPRPATRKAGRPRS